MVIAMNDTVNRMNALSGAFTAPLIDGVYSICQDTTVLLDIHVLIRTLWEKQQYEEAMRLLSILSRLIPATVFSPSEQIAGKDESSIFLEQFLADCEEILAEYATYAIRTFALPCSLYYHISTARARRCIVS